MRKFLVGIATLGIFVIYSIGLRHQKPVIAKPASLSKSSSNSSTIGGASQTTTSSGGSNTVGSSTSSKTTSPSTPAHYKDGNYTGSVSNAYYGQVQVAVSISGGKISNVKFLQYPNSHPASVYINQQVMPYLKQEAIRAQNANVQIISGATFTSQAFIQSLSNALSKAGA